MIGLILPPGSVEVIVDSGSDDRGILGLDDAIPAGVRSLRVAVSFGDVAAKRPQLESVARWAVDHCPVTDTTRRAVPVEVEVR